MMPPSRRMSPLMTSRPSAPPVHTVAFCNRQVSQRSSHSAAFCLPTVMRVALVPGTKRSDCDLLLKLGEGPGGTSSKRHLLKASSACNGTLTVAWEDPIPMVEATRAHWTAASTKSADKRTRARLCRETCCVRAVVSTTTGSVLSWSMAKVGITQYIELS